MRDGLHEHRVGARRDLRARDDRERDVQARHRRDRVVEANEQRMLEVEPADLGQRVDEPVEDAWRRRRQEEEHRLRADVREQARPSEAVVAVVATAVEERRASRP